MVVQALPRPARDGGGAAPGAVPGRGPQPLTRSLASATQCGPCGSPVPARRTTPGLARLRPSRASPPCESQEAAACGGDWAGGAAFRGQGSGNPATQAPAPAPRVPARRLALLLLEESAAHFHQRPRAPALLTTRSGPSLTRWRVPPSGACLGKPPRSCPGEEPVPCAEPQPGVPALPLPQPPEVGRGLPHLGSALSHLHQPVASSLPWPWRPPGAGDPHPVPETGVTLKARVLAASWVGCGVRPGDPPGSHRPPSLLYHLVSEKVAAGERAPELKAFPSPSCNPMLALSLSSGHPKSGGGGGGRCVSLQVCGTQGGGGRSPGWSSGSNQSASVLLAKSTGPWALRQGFEHPPGPPSLT